MRAVTPNVILDVQPTEFEAASEWLRQGLSRSGAYERGTWQSQDIKTRPEMRTRELWNVHFEYAMPGTIEALTEHVRPNLPWAEDHFQERVSGEPLNPPPSNEWWPFAQRGNAAHKSDGTKFSHTYPERFWAKYTGSKILRADRIPSGEYEFDADGALWDCSTMPETRVHLPDDAYVHKMRKGVRFDYGDLSDVVELLKREPFTRQAYLPVWFPEDTGVVHGERVPCTLGYHFVRNGHRLDCNYFMRSCDYFRHFRDDVYMAVRLTQWMRHQLVNEHVWPLMGRLNMFISNLHCFVGDDPKLERTS
jgi:hypothetical protein